MWPVHTPEGDPAPGWKDVLPPATTWTDLEVTVCSDRSQTQKDTSRVTPTHRGSLEESRPQRQRVDGGSQGGGVSASWEQGFSLGRWKVLETGGGGGCTTVCMCLRSVYLEC